MQYMGGQKKMMRRVGNLCYDKFITYIELEYEMAQFCESNNKFMVSINFRENYVIT